MFCYQCEQTVKGTGCTKIGVCGKTPEIANLQDLIIYQLKGISVYCDDLINKGESIDKEIVIFVENSLFTTLTNVNFDLNSHIKILKNSQKIKEVVRNKSNLITNIEEATFDILSFDLEDLLKYSVKAGIMYKDINEDIRSIRETITYSLKGISAYSHQARELGFSDLKIDNFYFKTLKNLVDNDLELMDLVSIALDSGEISVLIMKTLYDANSTFYKDPTPTLVNVNKVKGPFIVISGHDLKDLEELLKQTENTGVNVYTHGEMLPSHGYPELNKYKHLVGNFGGAWQNQQKEFDNIPGCILMTTNCIMKPKDSYKDRIFTTSVVGYENIVHISKNDNGIKDFSPIINKALELGGYENNEESKNILVGFGHTATLNHASTIVDYVNKGKIKHFFLIGGCDGAKPGRNYFTEFAQKVPNDSVILTLACGKYRFNKLEFGEIDGIPRLLDIGQCNDAYSAVKIALALSDAFKTDINGLPLSIVLSWYEQKAVADLLALLHLGIKGILLGPSIPAFLSKNVLNLLVDTFDIKPISNVDDDLAICLK